MSQCCIPCEGSGFLNIDQVPDDVDKSSVDAVLAWMIESKARLEESSGCSCHLHAPCSFCVESHDVAVCECCGDGDGWYGTPGEHYNADDQPGPNGPYASNGGLCKCH